MILVDTNVLSEPLKPLGDPRIAAWLDQQVAETLFVSSITVAELLLGVECLPAGKRRDSLVAGVVQQIEAMFPGRVLAFDLAAARAYAAIVAGARRAGQAIFVSDGQIAAIAKLNGLVVATRDEVPFRAAGVEVVNPWCL